MKNIVLIGMPSCGKTTIGRILSETTGRESVDTDAEIVKRAGKSIPEIFKEEGEKTFRDLETEAILSLEGKEGCVIACGGGAILRKENVDSLKKNGVLFFIEREVERLSCEGRPLSKNAETLREMEKIRLPMYRASADHTVDNNGDPMDAARKILEVMHEDRHH